jgi:hypothetical protein
MIRLRILARSRAALAALLSMSAASVACASTYTPLAVSAPRNPKQWTVLSCESCVQAGVQVSVRNSIDAKGNTGQHMAAQIRNLNPHAVVLVLQIVPEQSRPMDAALLSESFRVMLHPAGGSQDTSVVTVLARDLQAVAVHDVEKF